MKLTIVGATGGIGRHALAQALDGGHEVTAVVRDPTRLPSEAAAARVITADLATPDPAALGAATHGDDAVLSCLGPRTRRDTGIVAAGTRALLAAMRDAGVPRLVIVSAAPVGTVPSPDRSDPPRHDPGDDPITRYLLAPIVKRVFAANYADLARAEDALRSSDAEWTAVRPPRLVDGPLTGAYRTALDANLRGGRRVSRADVAHLMLAVLHRPETIRTTVGVAD